MLSNRVHKYMMGKDDVQCLQYKTDQVSDLKKIEKLNNKLFNLMALGEEGADDVDMVKAS